MAEWIDLRELACADQPHRIIGEDAGSMLGHPAFRRRILGWQQAFAAVQGQDWALYFDDALEFAAALFGAWHAGKCVYLPGDNLPGTLQRLAPLVAGFAGDIDAAWSPLTAVANPVDAPLAALDEEAAGLVVFTSGSTGEPDAIDKRLRQLLREIEALQAAFGPALGEACVHGTVSHQHIYGLLFRVLWPLAAGRAIMPRRFFHEDIVGTLASGPSILIATPAHLKRLPDQLDWATLDGQLRAVFSSGGPLPQDSALQVRRLLGVAPTEVFGSSETGGIAWRRWSAERPEWHPLPAVQWRIDDGCLAVQSPHLRDGGWWRSQDRVEAADGESFRLLGRADRIVKIEERRVSLDALEQRLRLHPEVADVRVLVLSGAREQLAAVVVPVHAVAGAGADSGADNGTGADALDEPARRAFALRLGQHLSSSHDAVTRPRRWRFTNALPQDAQGKVTRAGLAALFRPHFPRIQWMQREPGHAVLEMPLDPDLLAFDGHFPQASILPGVAQLDWAIRCGRTAFDIPPRFLRMDALKFQHVARPGDVLTLDLGWDAERGALSFRYHSIHGVHASGKVLFADAA